jgi:hypothetical protein
MSYFTHFPSTGYILDENTAKVVKAKNILLRAKFSEYLKTNNSLLFLYSIRDGDRPETIANIVYNRSDLHWIVLLFNDIINPYHEWPLTDSEFEAMVKLLYPGTTLYIRDDSVLYERGTVTPAIPFFETGSTIYQGSVSAMVVSYNRTLGELVVDNITGGDFQTKTTKSDGTVQLGAQITQTNSLGNAITATITRAELTPYAVHHFEDSDGNWLDPRCKFAPPNNATNGVSYRPYQNIPKSLINLYSDPSVDATGNTTGEGIVVAQQAVSNMNYEYSKNEEKRQISILKPMFLDDIIKQFSDLFKV